MYPWMPQVGRRVRGVRQRIAPRAQAAPVVGPQRQQIHNLPGDAFVQVELGSRMISYASFSGANVPFYFPPFSTLAIAHPFTPSPLRRAFDLTQTNPGALCGTNVVACIPVDVASALIESPPPRPRSQAHRDAAEDAVRLLRAAMAPHPQTPSTSPDP